MLVAAGQPIEECRLAGILITGQCD